MSRLTKQAGNTILMVLVPLSIVTASFFVLSNVIVQERGQVLKNTNLVSLRFALNSLADYMAFAVRQRWCFNSSFISDSPCTLAHPGATERVMMSNEEVNFIKELVASGVDIGAFTSVNSLVLDKFELNVAISNLSRLHPLSPVLETLRGQGVNGIYVKVARDDNAYMPRSGGEVYLTITIDLVDPNGIHPMMLGTSPLQVITHLSVYKRELNSFALIVPRDLHLDSGGGTKGDLFLASPTGASGPGLVFESPVFVNQNIHLPASGYTPVTFAERVYIGNGQVLIGNKPFSPAAAGGETATHWTDGKQTFGGFLAGIQIDGQLDRGLEAGWWGTIPPSNAGDLMKACIARNLFLTDSSQLANTKLYANYLGNSGGIYNYNVGWDVGKTTNPREVNEFTGQFVQQSVTQNAMASTGGWANPPKDIVTVPRMVFGDGTVAELQVFYGNDQVKFQMTGEGEVDINPDISDTLQQTLASTKSSNDTQQAKLDSDSKALADYKSQNASNVATWQSDFSDAQAAKTAAQTSKSDAQTKLLAGGLTTAQKNALNAQIATANSDITQANTDMINATNKMNTYNAKVASLQTTVASQTVVASNAANAYQAAQYNVDNYQRPKISITTAPVTPAGTTEPQPQLLNLQVGLINPKWMVDTSLKPVAVSVGLKGYDPTYIHGVEQMTPKKNAPTPNNMLVQYLSFGMPATGVTAPATLAANQNGSSPAASYKEEDYDWGKLDDDCDALNGTVGTNQAFGGANWNYDFASQTRSSWNFKGDSNLPVATDPVLGSLVFDGGSSTTTYSKWQVRSIVGVCTIRSSATLVTGFFACDSLVIEPRGVPLKIIGTFIAGSVTIDPSALRAGITWSSIYYPPATTDLRDAKTLHTATSSDNLTDVNNLKLPACKEFPDPNDPIWNPIPALTNVANRFACNAISLRASANPFQWTSVDPDCGVVVSGRTPNSNTTCKNHPTNFYVFEYAREGGL